MEVVISHLTAIGLNPQELINLGQVFNDCTVEFNNDLITCVAIIN